MNFIGKAKDMARDVAGDALNKAKDVAAGIDIDFDAAVIKDQIDNLQERFSDESITGTADGPLDVPSETEPTAPEA